MVRLLRSLLDLIFPPRCVYCDRLLDSSQQSICKKCEAEMPWIPDDEPLVKGKHFSSCACAAWYRKELRKTFLAYKFRGRTEHAAEFGNALARTIALRLPEDYDVLTWVPVSRERRRERGYDQSQLLAEAAAKLLERPVLSTLEKVHTRAQSGLDGVQARLKNVQDAFWVTNPVRVRGKTVLLIDDLFTSGSTLESASQALLAAGAAEVRCACFARAVPKSAATETETD